jgi:nicotinamidase-related amidase
MKALVIVDMTNDFVHEEYEDTHEVSGEVGTYKGSLVAPLGKEIITPISQLLEQARNDGAKPLMVKKDHYDGFTNPKLAETLDDNGIDEVWVTGLVDEICIYHNTMGFHKNGYNPTVVSGATKPFDVKVGKEKMKELKKEGVPFCGTDEVPTLDFVLYLEDLHTEQSPEIDSGDWPPHNMVETPGAKTIKEFRDILY